ncbi:hypothetical protein HOU70_gp41 [Arthrobacter phage Liebe]|uniref:Uncharacterized protein n=3 Tax=Liebevirus TaxID=2733187 RepID=A0A3G2KHQ2_9CAUD|nr:hypothetical protein HOU70_gp41 [Arthrobacter phage Liebe]AYN58522.1 hypothetical protein PBI_MAUREEN_41 [Arthrobacter phage Maureen]AZF93774.1 hypothetical protein PBI_LIEBE_41 [Arthrobacter phage Liebe]WGH20331.1 hypothetical protein SEA_MAGUCO_39 [Arthrobacter phage MaGuCo]
MDLDDDVDLSLDPREYVCGVCRLTHWRGAPDPCDRV